MKKILILAYFFPPCNLTASQRALGWAKYLNSFGYYPVIVSRNWDILIASPADVLRDSGDELRIEKKEGYEVHYLPYRASLRDRVFTRFSGTPLAFLSKPLTAMELLAQGFTYTLTPHANMYDHAARLLEDDGAFSALIASGKPFDLFHFAFRLNRRFNIPWMADYRDPWNTQHPDLAATSPSERFGFNQGKLEKKWVGSASVVTTVSSTLLEGICQFTGKPGRVLLNGYMDEEYTAYEANIRGNPDRTAFSILHVGNLPELALIEVFIEGFKAAVESLRGMTRLTVNFVGVNYIGPTADKLRQLSAGFEEYITLTDRIPREQVMQMQDDAHLLLMVGHGYKGYPSSKIYEYVGTGKPVLLCPSDHDIMEDTLRDTGQAIVCNSPEETATALTGMVRSWLEGGKLPYHLHTESRKRYARSAQTASLAAILDELSTRQQ